MIDNTYQQQKKIRYETQLIELKNELPEFCKDYIRDIGNVTELSTQIGYLIDLKMFFNYIIKSNPLYKKKNIKDITVDTLGKMTLSDLLEFFESVNHYTKPKKDTQNTENVMHVTNDKQGIKRKQAAVRSLYKHLYKKECIEKNPAELLTTPKIISKKIIFLKSEEVSKLLYFIEHYDNRLENLKKKGNKEEQKKLDRMIQNHKASKERDIAMVTLLLGTGMRVSECIGIDLMDIDYTNLSITITKKGGDDMNVFFNEYVKEKLLNYLEVRKNIKRVPPDHEQALFLSKQKKRIGVRTVEKMVKQYTNECFETNKHITPHKLRSTYGTHLYRATGDINLVCDALGHKDVNTAKRHYVQGSEEMRKLASEKIAYLSELSDNKDKNDK